MITDTQLIMRMHNQGMSVPEIADAIGDSRRSVRATIVREWRLDKERGKAARLRARVEELNAWMEGE